MKTTDAVIGKWPGVLAALGINEKYLSGKHGPCPVCAGKDRFRFDNKDGKGTYYCNQCGAGTGWKLLEMLNGWNFATAAREIDKVLGNIQGTAIPKRVDPLPRLKKIAEDLVDIVQCKSVENYLFSRGLKQIPTTLKAHPALPYYHDRKRIGNYPAMIARVVDPDNKPLTLHCTYTENGKKLSGYDCRKVMTPVRSMNCGAAIRLFEVGEVMGIAEGIETAIAAFQLFGIPTWSVIHANGIKGFLPPGHCKKLIIYADNDHSFTGQEAAYSLAKKLSGRLKVEIKMPELVGTDWADLIE